jgi:hypothetical protein
MEPSSPPILSGQTPRTTWFGRNWKWFVPLICLVPVALFVGFFVLLFTLVTGFIKSSDAYQIPLATAKTNSLVIRAIGSPVKEGFFTSGKVNSGGATGNANLAIPISGPNGRATIHVVATRSDGTWHFSTMTVKANGTTINLQPQKNQNTPAESDDP